MLAFWKFTSFYLIWLLCDMRIWRIGCSSLLKHLEPGCICCSTGKSLPQKKLHMSYGTVPVSGIFSSRSCVWDEVMRELSRRVSEWSEGLCQQHLVVEWKDGKNTWSKMGVRASGRQGARSKRRGTTLFEAVERTRYRWYAGTRCRLTCYSSISIDWNSPSWLYRRPSSL